MKLFTVACVRMYVGEKNGCLHSPVKRWWECPSATYGIWLHRVGIAEPGRGQDFPILALRTLSLVEYHGLNG